MNILSLKTLLFSISLFAFAPNTDPVTSKSLAVFEDISISAMDNSGHPLVAVRSAPGPESKQVSGH